MPEYRELEDGSPRYLEDGTTQRELESDTSEIVATTANFTTLNVG